MILHPLTPIYNQNQVKSNAVDDKKQKSPVHHCRGLLINDIYRMYCEFNTPFPY